MAETAEEFIKRKEEEYRNEDKKIKVKDIGREGYHWWNRESWVFMPQTNLPEKVFVVERLRRIKIEGKSFYKNSKEGDIEYRIGYYIVGKKWNKSGRWTWGQYCPLIPQEDFKKLIKLAEEKGVVIR